MTTFKVFEQVGEITITNIRSAEENRRIANEVKEKEKKEKEERERQEAIEKKMREEKERQEAMEFLVNVLIPTINKEAEAGRQVLSLFWCESWCICKHENYGISYNAYKSYFKYFSQILNEMGYRVDPIHEYSQGWRNQSGKIGYAYIWW